MRRTCFEKENSLNGEYSNHRLSQGRGSPRATVDDFVAVQSTLEQLVSTRFNKQSHKSLTFK
jgi:hypothetical protein